MAYVLGADFGGGSCKITLLDDQGNARASFSEEYPSYFPHPMWVEQDPDEIFRAFSDCLSRLWSEVPGAASEIKAIALDGGTHIAVLLDGEGRVIRPAIYWQDSRSTKESEEAEKAMGDALRERTFNIPSSMPTRSPGTVDSSRLPDWMRACFRTSAILSISRGLSHEKPLLRQA